MRCQEICNINIRDVENTGTQFIVTVRDTKNYYPRNFIIGTELYDKVNDYIKLRPNNLNTDRFFLQYKNGLCVRQVIGKNKISEVPKMIAMFLKLEDPESYTGHCLRRTAATLLANSGANMTTVKQLGGWKSSSVAEGYVEHSLANRKKIFQGIINSDNSMVKENLPTRTSPAYTVTTATATQAATVPADTSVFNTDKDEYPPFDIDDIDDSTLLVESNIQRDFVKNSVDNKDSPSHQDNIFSRKRVIFKNIANANNPAFLEQKKKNKSDGRKYKFTKR